MFYHKSMALDEGRRRMAAPAKVLKFPSRQVRPPETRFEGGYVRDCRRPDSILTDQIHIAFWKYLCRHAANRLDARPLGGQEIRLDGGQIAINLRQMARDFRMSRQEIRTLMGKLVEAKRITAEPISATRRQPVGNPPTTQSRFVGVRVTILNYYDYQNRPGSNNPIASREEHVGNQQVREKGRKEKDSPSSSLREEDSSANDDLFDLKPPPGMSLQEQAIAVWNEVCGDLLPKVTSLGRSGKRCRSQQLTSRLRDECGGHLEWWRDFCQRVRASAFLTGQIEPKNGDRPFIAGFDWCLQPRNFQKVIEGNYDDRQSRRTETLEQWASRLAREHADQLYGHGQGPV